MRTYLPDGRAVVWAAPHEAGTAHAVDAEPAYARVSSRLARRVGSDDPVVVWTLWTRAEVIAKLFDLPLLSWLAWPGLMPPAALADQVALRTILVPDDATGGIRVTCGTVGSLTNSNAAGVVPTALL
ncbi:MAG: hypothetical protein M3Y49_01265 [Actinomycetota bacterium]|nr:hypothetical protein [Actinomycetota bacterium]